MGKTIVIFILGIALFFATDLHHLVIAALDDSYTLFHPGEVPLTGDMAALTTRTIASAFLIGVQLSAPFHFPHCLYVFLPDSINLLV